MSTEPPWDPSTTTEVDRAIVAARAAGEPAFFVAARLGLSVDEVEARIAQAHFAMLPVVSEEAPPSSVAAGDSSLGQPPANTGNRNGPAWAVAILAAAVVIGLVAFFAAHGSSSAAAAPSVTSEAPAPAEPTYEPQTVEYCSGSDGTVTSADLTTMTANGDIKQQTGAVVPFQSNKPYQGQSSGCILAGRGSFYASMSLQNRGSYGSLTCSIRVNGEVVVTNTSSGAYAVVTCSADA